MEKALQELQGKFDQMMSVMARMARGKKAAKNPGSQEGHTHQNKKNPDLPLIMLKHPKRHTCHKCHRWEGTHIPHLVGQPPNNEPILGTSLTDLILILKLDDPKRKEKVSESSLE